MTVISNPVRQDREVFPLFIFELQNSTFKICDRVIYNLTHKYQFYVLRATEQPGQDQIIVPVALSADQIIVSECSHSPPFKQLFLLSLKYSYPSSIEFVSLVTQTLTRPFYFSFSPHLPRSITRKGEKKEHRAPPFLIFKFQNCDRVIQHSSLDSGYRQLEKQLCVVSFE